MELLATHRGAPYQASKCSLFASFLAFVNLRQDGHTAFTSTPDDVVDFLIASDANGKTVIHTGSCSSKGRGTRPCAGGPRLACPCPTRLAFGTVDNMIGRLSSNFHDLGVPGYNPAGARMVKQYLSSIRNEQLQKGIVPAQSKPIFSEKIRRISREIRLIVAAGEGLTDAGKFTMLRTRAMLVLDACSLKRGAELGTTLTDSVVRFPDDSGLIFNYVWGKTLRSGSSHVFGVLRKPLDLDLCPVSCLDDYVNAADSLGIDLRGPASFLFRPWRNGAPNEPLVSAQLAVDLRYWLVRCDIYDNDTLHGVRTGGAIEQALRGERLRSVMDQALWSRPDTAKRYMKIWQVMCASVSDSSDPTLGITADPTKRYTDMNEMMGMLSL